jgi:hypothetical protein
VDASTLMRLFFCSIDPQAARVAQEIQQHTKELPEWRRS